jgi:hypothetical protein
MDIRRSLRYFMAMDITNKARMHEVALYLEHGLDPNISLPLQTGLRGAAEIYGTRTAAIVKGTGAIMCRLTGVDAAFRTLTDTEFPA